ncbi:MAG: hypothetical protein ACLFNJ_03370 [Bacteroidales bacterium]
MGKLFTATVIGMLYDKGLLDFDDKKIQELIDENANLQIDINSFFSRCHYSQLSLVL